MTRWEYATTVVTQDWPYAHPEEDEGGSPVYYEHQGNGPDGAPVSGITELLATWDAAGWEFVTAIRQDIDVVSDHSDVARHEATYGKMPEGMRLWGTETHELLIFRRPTVPRE